VHDLLLVGSASAREGLRRTLPRLEKKARPWRVCGGAEALEEAEGWGGGDSHGVDASGPSSDMRISILASPHGASVLNMWIETLERILKGGYALSFSLGSRVMLADSDLSTGR
jgi:hypothetical protein